MISGVEHHEQVCLSTMPPPQCPPSRHASSVLPFATHAIRQTRVDKMPAETCLLGVGSEKHAKTRHTAVHRVSEDVLQDVFNTPHREYRGT